MSILNTRWGNVPLVVIIRYLRGGTDMYAASNPDQNKLLAALPAEAKNRIFPQLKPARLALDKTLCETGEMFSHVFFPTSAIVSMLFTTENGHESTVGVAGNEGMIGIALFMGGECTSTRTVVQSAGDAWCMTGYQFRQEINNHHELRNLLLRYSQYLITQMSQTAVCNRFHSINQQLCRWLLLSMDRVRHNHLTMTQSLIANNLGVRREGVTEAACTLQRQGIIEYRRGMIVILDRVALERLSCECYKVTEDEMERLLPHKCSSASTTHTKTDWARDRQSSPLIRHQVNA